MENTRQTPYSSSTMTILENEQDSAPIPKPLVTLTLKPRKDKRSVKWQENVVDNEDLEKKTSKKCCIYHKKKAFGESSTESSDEECNHC